MQENNGYVFPTLVYLLICVDSFVRWAINLTRERCSIFAATADNPSREDVAAWQILARVLVPKNARSAAGKFFLAIKCSTWNILSFRFFKGCFPSKLLKVYLCLRIYRCRRHGVRAGTVRLFRIVWELGDGAVFLWIRGIAFLQVFSQ